DVVGHGSAGKHDSTNRRSDRLLRQADRCRGAHFRSPLPNGSWLAGDFRAAGLRHSVAFVGLEARKSNLLFGSNFLTPSFCPPVRSSLLLIVLASHHFFILKRSRSIKGHSAQFWLLIKSSSHLI